MIFSRALLYDMCWVPKEEVRSIEAEKKGLTISGKFDDASDVVLWKQTSKMFGVPLCHWKGLDAEKLIDKRSVGNVAKFQFTSLLREEQQRLAEKFRRNLESGRTGFILQAPPGFGKTVLLLKMAQIVGRTAVVVVPRSNLVGQWAERILEHTNIRREQIGIISGTKMRWKGAKIIVGLVHTLALGRFEDELKEVLGVAIFDEVDRSVPPKTFCPVVEMFPSRVRIGASALLRRPDGLHVVFQKHMGECMLSGQDDARMIPQVIVHRYAKNSGYLHGGSKRLNRRGMLLTLLANSTERNMLLCKYINLIYRSDRKQVVLSDRTYQLWMLAAMMEKIHGIDKEDIGFYTSSLDTGSKKLKVSEEERGRVASDCNIIFACMSDDTECLTLRGWRSYDKLRIGEPIASYDSKTGRICYEPLDKVAVYDFDGELCHVDRKHANILMTWNHRNVIVGGQGKEKGVVSIRAADRLRKHDKILLTAPVDYPVNKGFERIEWPELFGWVIAEGSYQYNAVKLSQAEGVDSRRIQWLLDTLQLDHTTWLEEHIRRWHLTVGASLRFFQVCPDRLLNEWLASLPQAQLVALFDGLVKGDGSKRDDGRRSFIQKSRTNLDWFSVIALRLGFSQLTTPREDDTDCSVVYLTEKRTVGLTDGKFKLKSVAYKGKIWCPVVSRTGTWIARRKGSVFITGNTYGMMALGTDIPELAALVYATPQSEVAQSKGRIERLFPDKKEPVVIDVIDMAYKDAVGWGDKRLRKYRRGRLTITERKDGKF